jgi:hypothetical protein
VNIRKYRMEEIIWDNNWKQFTSWGMEVGAWKEETKFLEKISNQHYLVSPHIKDLASSKEVESKFIIS